MPIYCHFLYKSEYQFENNWIKHVVFSALSKSVSPPDNDNPQVPSGRGGGGGVGFEKSDTSFIETKSDAVL